MKRMASARRGVGGGCSYFFSIIMSFTLTILCFSYAQTMLGGRGGSIQGRIGWGKGKATGGGFVVCSLFNKHDIAKVGDYLKGENK